MESTKRITTGQEAAQAMGDAFIISERDNGEKFYHLRDGSPEWMTDVCRKAHGEMFPDDWRYQFISDAVDILAESDDWDEARDEVEADIYTSQLTAWLASRTGRYSYCDQYVEEMGADGDTLARISGGQWMERCEVFGLVAEALGDIGDSQEDDEA